MECPLQRHCHSAPHTMPSWDKRVSCPNTLTYGLGQRVVSLPRVLSVATPLQPFSTFLVPLQLLAPGSRPPRQEDQAFLTAGLEVRGGGPCTSSWETDLTHEAQHHLWSHLLGSLSLQPPPLWGIDPPPTPSLLGGCLHKLRPLFSQASRRPSGQRRGF